MKYTKLSILTAFISLFFPVFAYASENIVAMPQPEKEWTFMLFMAADNNLESAAVEDVNELERFGSNESVNFVAQIDRNGGYSARSDVKWSGTRRFYVVKDKDRKHMTSPVIEDLGDVDSASSKTMLDFVTWAKENFPARKYALILWNHGTGWKEISPSMEEGDVEEGRGYEIGLSTSMKELSKEKTEGMPSSFSFSGSYPSSSKNKSRKMGSAPKISYNIAYDYTSNTSMDIPTLQKTLEEASEILGQPFELLGYDACLMQMIEVGWAAAGSAKYQVGSPDLEPARGWPYIDVSRFLTDHPGINGEELGKFIIDAYVKSYSGGSQGNTAVALSMFNFSEIDNLREDIDRFCKAVISNVSSDIDRIEENRTKSLMYSYNDYIDLGHFLALMCSDKKVSAPTKSAARNLLKTICGSRGQGGFVSRVASNGDKFKETRGLSIFFPNRTGFKAYRTRYKTQLLAKDTMWFEMLEELSKPNMPYFKLEDILFVDNNKDGRIASGEKVKGNLIIRNFGKKTTESGTAVFESDSKYLVENKQTVKLGKMPSPGRKKTMKAFELQLTDNAPIHEEISYKVTINSKGAPEATITGSFFVKEAFSSTSNALLVYYDAYSPAVPILEIMFQKAGVPFDSWDRSIDGEIGPEVLKRYQDGWVFICCQDSTPEQSLSDDEIEALDAFLKVGGRAVLDGQDIPFCLRDHDFLLTRCKSKFVQDDVNVHVVKGIGNFLKGKSFQIFGGDGANNQKWPDEIDPQKGAEVIFKYEEDARDIADEREMNGPDHKPTSFTRGIISSGAAAIRVRDGYRLMLFGFNVESINNAAQRGEIMKQIAEFMHPDPESEIKNYARAAGRRVVADKYRSVDRVMTERADLLSCVESRLVKEIKETVKRDPSAKQRILASFRNLSQKEQKVASKLERALKGMFNFEDAQSERR